MSRMCRVGTVRGREVVGAVGASGRLLIIVERAPRPSRHVERMEVLTSGGAGGVRGPVSFKVRGGAH